MTVLHVEGPIDQRAIAAQFESLMFSGDQAENPGVTVIRNHPSLDVDEDELRRAVEATALGPVRFVQPRAVQPPPKKKGRWTPVVVAGALVAADIGDRIVRWLT